MRSPRHVLILFVCAATLPALARSAAAGPDTRWGVGLRTTSLELVSSLRSDSSIAVDGGGLHLRLRLAPRWELELSSVTVRGELAHGALSRESKMATLSALIHLGPRHYQPIDWYLIAGLGTTNDQVSYQRVDRSWASESFAETHFHLGLGVAHHFRHLVLAAEVRAVGMARNDDQLDQPRYQYIDGPVPFESSGSQLDLVATYYF